jgi:hypothetical protein
MPASDLKSLREYVANVLDYDPNNETYKRQIDRLLNEADRAICLAKPFTFINKAVDVTVYKDRGATLSFTSGNRVVTAGAPFFESWMVNQELVADDVTYIIRFVDSTTQARIDRAFESATASYDSSVINRYIDLPADCTTVLGVARRTNTRTPNDPGMLSPLSRYEDEWWNLPLGETNLPIYWVNHDPDYISAPRRNFNVATVATGAGQGVRTVEFTSTFIRGGRESNHGEVVSLQAGDTQDFQLTPFSGVANDGLKKRYYFRAPALGYHAWRLLSDPTTGGDMELDPTDVTARNLVALDRPNLVDSESLVDDSRIPNSDGFTQRIRLYPRQDKDYVFTIRYMRRHEYMADDGDTSAIPPDQRMMIAYKALSDIFMKHDNPTQSELYRRRFDEIMLRLEKRYLITPARRIVKGNWLANMEPNSFSRFTTLVQT